MKQKEAPEVPDLQPFGELVLLQALPEEDEKTEGGIVLPDSARGKGLVLKGKVIAVGQGKWIDGKLIAAECEEGQTVLYPARRGYPYGKDDAFVLISSFDLLGVIGDG